MLKVWILRKLLNRGTLDKGKINSSCLCLKAHQNIARSANVHQYQASSNLITNNYSFHDYYLTGCIVSGQQSVMA